MDRLAAAQSSTLTVALSRMPTQKSASAAAPKKADLGCNSGDEPDALRVFRESSRYHDGITI